MVLFRNPPTPISVAPTYAIFHVGFMAIAIVVAFPLTTHAQQVFPVQQSQVSQDVPLSGQPIEQYIDPNIIYESEYGESSNAGSEIPVGEDYLEPGFLNVPFFNIATDYSTEMLDFQNRQTSKETFLLEHSFRNGGQTMATLGMQFRGSALVANTNRADKFSYLGRFPTDFEGTRASDIRLLQANQGFSFTFTPTAHGYFETLFSDVFSFGDFKQGSFQVRQAYVVFGDFSRSPLYAYLGKKTVGFGDMQTLSPFTQAVTWHYFAALAEGGGLGFDNGTLQMTVAALNGSRGIRVADSEAKGDLNNFAANLLLRLPTGRMFDGGQDSELKLGAGYLNGTIYDGNTAEHLDPGITGERNGAWDVNAYARIRRLHLAAEYVQTESVWPVTNHRVSAFRTEAALDSTWFGSPARWSVSWSEGKQGSPDTEFEFNQQLVVGYSIQPNPYAKFSLEYVRSSGFAPLMNITVVSDRDVNQDSIVFGIDLVL
jgi:hypothetical protein